jgi:hypothetical protein
MMALSGSAMADDDDRPKTSAELTEEARRLAQREPPPEAGQATRPWEHGDGDAPLRDQRRAFSDSVEDTPLVDGRTLDPRTLNRLTQETAPDTTTLPDGRALPSGAVLPAGALPPAPKTQLVAPARKASLSEVSRRDLLYEEGAVADLNGMPVADTRAAMEQIHRIVTRPAESGGLGIPLTQAEQPPLPDGGRPGRPEKLPGGWRALPFTSDPPADLVDQRGTLARRLRANLEDGLNHTIRPALGAAADLRALPEDLKIYAMDDIRQLAEAGPDKDDVYLQVPGRRADEIRSRLIGEDQHLIYRQVKASSHAADQRPIIELLGVTNGTAADIASRIQPEGRIVFRYLTGGRSPGPNPAVQVLAVQAPGNVPNIKTTNPHLDNRLAGLQARTVKHQELTGREKPLWYSAEAKNAVGEVVVQAAHQVTAETRRSAASDGGAPLPVPKKAVPNAEGFTVRMAAYMPGGRAYDLVFADGTEAELRGLVDPVKRPVFDQLRSLASGGGHAADPRGSAEGPGGADLRMFRARTVGGAVTDGTQPTIPAHQIVYREAKRPKIRKNRGQEPYVEERGIIHIVTVRRQGDPDIPQTVVDRGSPGRQPGPNRGLTAGPRLALESSPEPITSEQGRADRRITEHDQALKARQQAARARSATAGQGSPVPSQDTQAEQRATQKSPRRAGRSR